MTYLRIFGAIGVMASIFLFGMWITWPGFPYNPSGFPINRKFIAISLNDKSLVQSRSLKSYTFEIRREAIFRLTADGTALCNHWDGDVMLSRTSDIAWAKISSTTTGCSPVERTYLNALLSAKRWRTEGGFLVLENGTDVLRFARAPK